jgi:hypothetical protein
MMNIKRKRKMEIQRKKRRRLPGQRKLLRRPKKNQRKLRRNMIRRWMRKGVKT